MHHHHQTHSPLTHTPLTHTPNSQALAKSMEAERAFVPAPDEIARRAYFAYVNEGSMPGHEVQHWLGAEAELISERDRTRHHGYHNQT